MWGLAEIVLWSGTASPCLWHGPAGSGVKRVAKEGDRQGFIHPTLTAPWSCSVLQPGQLQTALMSIPDWESSKLVLQRTRGKMGIVEQLLA